MHDKLLLDVILQAVMPLRTETPTKSSGNSDRGLMKKLKGFDGLAMSIGNGNNAESANDGAENRISQRYVEQVHNSIDRFCCFQLSLYGIY